MATKMPNPIIPVSSFARNKPYSAKNSKPISVFCVLDYVLDNI
jgi:hypothetical protein